MAMGHVGADDDEGEEGDMVSDDDEDDRRRLAEEDEAIVRLSATGPRSPRLGRRGEGGKRNLRAGRSTQRRCGASSRTWRYRGDAVEM